MTSLLADVLVEYLVRHGGFFSAAVFWGFFAVSALVLLLRDREEVRRTYVVLLLVALLGSSLTGLQPIPLVNANEYTSVSSEQYVHYDLRVVDADGRELPYDPQAMRPAIQNEELAENMGEVNVGSEKTEISYTEAERRAMAAFLLREASEYRTDVEAGWNPLSVFRFPPHHLRGHWSAEELAGYSEFVGIRIYRIEVTFTDDGRRTIEGDSELVYEYRPEGNESA